MVISPYRPAPLKAGIGDTAIDPCPIIEIINDSRGYVANISRRPMMPEVRKPSERAESMIPEVRKPSDAQNQ